MKIDPWTVAFQLVNFAVLLWVLSRLLFKPVREIMARRAAQVAADLEAAARERAAAARLAAETAAQRRAAEAGRAEALRQLEDELARLRRERLSAAATEAEGLLERGRAQLDARRRELEEQLRRRAARAAVEFAGALLTDLADRELHAALLRRLPGQLAKAAAPGEGQGEVLIESAFALSGDDEAGLRGSLGPVFPGRDLRTAVEPALLAGVRLRAADTVYDLSLRGQLDGLGARLGALA